MENIKTITLDSISNVQDMIDDGIYGNLDAYIKELEDTAEVYGLDLTDVQVDEDQDIITGDINYDDIQAVRDWLSSVTPELSDEDIDDILAA